MTTNEKLDWIIDSIVELQKQVSKLSVQEEVLDTRLHNRLKKFFLDWYKKEYKDSYYWQAKDSISIKRIIKKIGFKIKEKNNAEATDEQILKSFEIVITNIEDDWILSNLSVNLIDSKLNQLVNQLRNTSKEKQDGKTVKANTAFDNYDRANT